jgi:hypothetical protein
MRQRLDEILEKYPDETFLIADGFDDAVIGVDENSMRLVYSTERCIDILVREHRMDYMDASDYFYYNVSGAYVGEQTPIFIDDNFGI